MTKKDLLKYLSKKTSKPMAKIDEILLVLIECITKTVSKGDKLTIPGLGTFSSKKRAARVGRNPQTAVSIKIPARKVPKFSASKILKDAVRK